MSPSTPDKRKPRIPFQPNPFGNSAVGSPWTERLPDVPGINDAPFRLLVDALRQMRAGGKGTSIVISGDPGSGKTHLLGRLRTRLEQDERESKAGAAYVYVRCNASASTLWRHLRYGLVSDLLKGGAPQLYGIFENYPGRLDSVNHQGVRRALESLHQERHVQTAAAWLRGESLTEADLAAIGVAVEKDDEDPSRERDAHLVVDSLLEFLAPVPVVLCFDQVEALQTYRGDEAGFHAMGQLISALHDGHNHLLLITCIISAFEDNLDRLPNGADHDRWLQYKATLRPIDWKQAEELISVRLASAQPLSAGRQAHAEDPLWPLDAGTLQPLFAATGLCLPRKLIQACRQQFAELLTGEDEPRAKPKSREAFLAAEYEANLNEARRLVARQGADKTLADSLPWLLQNSGFQALESDGARSPYASQAWRGPAGRIALAFCFATGTGLTNQFKRLDRHWSANEAKLLILRNAATAPGPVGARLLAGLEQRGAKQIHPLPEAIAALQAIRNLTATARSGELFLDDEPIGEQAVSDWALAHLSPEVQALRTELTAMRPAGEDLVLPKLAALIVQQKIVAADMAARELGLTAEEVKECAHRHPLRFGLLDGPPVVIFEASVGSAR